MAGINEEVHTSDSDSSDVKTKKYSLKPYRKKKKAREEVSVSNSSDSYMTVDELGLSREVLRLRHKESGQKSSLSGSIEIRINNKSKTRSRTKLEMENSSLRCL